MLFVSVVGAILDLEGQLGEQYINRDKTAHLPSRAAVVLIGLLRMPEKRAFGKTEGSTCVRWS